jgi:CRISPR-associated protein Cas2
MFDLPVALKAERQAATQFRNTLLDLGFEMSQYSVYLRFCTGQTQCDTLTKRVEAAVPAGGSVNVLFITDKQFERTLSFSGKEKNPPQKPPNQFELF